MFAKFIPGLDGLMPPLAGALNVTTVLFLLFDAVGALLWSAGYCFVGYLFADHLDIVAATLGRVSGILAIMIGGVLFYLIWRAWELIRIMRQLRLRVVSPALLYQNLKTGKKVAALDLLDVEGQESPTVIPGIPGAARISPTPLRSSAKVRVPPDVQIVLYCSSPNQLISARTALALRRKGISNVWVLRGGLKAWRELGLPVTTNLSSPAQVAARFGIELAE
jgi:rhodanese-related sulfurtransferase